MYRTLSLLVVSVCACTLVAVVVSGESTLQQHTQHAAAAAQHAHNHALPSAAERAARLAPMKPAPPGALPALPVPGFEPVEPESVYKPVYEFAARHPEVLQYMPCYCGCEAVGHVSNHDCFVQTRAATGRIVAWDTHGMGCAVCINVGRKAMAMFNQGMPVRDIRAAIEREYGPRYSRRTPTPMPPAPSRAAKKG